MAKYKLKSSRAIVKRFKVTANGKCLRHKAGRSHLLQKKTSSRKSKLRKVIKLQSVDYISFKCKILYSE